MPNGSTKQDWQRVKEILKVSISPFGHVLLGHDRSLCPLRECIKMIDDDVGKSHKDVIDDKIIGYYVDGKLSEDHRQLLKDKFLSTMAAPLVPRDMAHRSREITQSAM
jgi:hypothetical protein